MFHEREDGLWVVKEVTKYWGEDIIFDGVDAPDMARGVARVPMEILDEVIEAAEECPGECIMIEPFSQDAFDKRMDT